MNTNNVEAVELTEEEVMDASDAWNLMGSCPADMDTCANSRYDFPPMTEVEYAYLTTSTNIMSIVNNSHTNLPF